jgi:hypothetical protein
MIMVLVACSTHSKVTRPIKKSEGNKTRPKMKKSVPRWDICPTNARAIKVLDLSKMRSSLWFRK